MNFENFIVKVLVRDVTLCYVVRETLHIMAARKAKFHNTTNICSSCQEISNRIDVSLLEWIRTYFDRDSEESISSFFTSGSYPRECA